MFRANDADFPLFDFLFYLPEKYFRVRLIAEAIEKSSLTYMEIAERLGMNYYNNITKWKTADNINFKTLAALALVLDCRIRDLYEE